MRRALEILRAEFDKVLAYSGCARLTDIRRDHVVFAGLIHTAEDADGRVFHDSPAHYATLVTRWRILEGYSPFQAGTTRPILARLPLRRCQGDRHDDLGEKELEHSRAPIFIVLSLRSFIPRQGLGGPLKGMRCQGEGHEAIFAGPRNQVCYQYEKPHEHGGVSQSTDHPEPAHNRAQSCQYANRSYHQANPPEPFGSQRVAVCLQGHEPDKKTDTTCGGKKHYCQNELTHGAAPQSGFAIG